MSRVHKRTFLKRLTRTLYDKKWYDKFTDSDPYKAWGYLRRQVQFQCFRNEFTCIPDLENFENYQLWDTFIKMKVPLYDIIEPPVMLPIGCIFDYSLFPQPQTRDDHLGKKARQSMTSLYTDQIYKAAIRHSRQGVPKEIVIELHGIDRKSVPVLAPKEFQINKARMRNIATIKDRHGIVYDPKMLYIIQDVAIVRRLIFRMGIKGIYTTKELRDIPVGFSFSRYTNFWNTGMIRYPDSYDDGLRFIGFIEDPVYPDRRKWAERAERERRDREAEKPREPSFPPISNTTDSWEDDVFLPSTTTTLKTTRFKSLPFP